MVAVVSVAGVSARRGANRRDTNSLFHNNCICLRMCGAASKCLVGWVWGRAGLGIHTYIHCWMLW